MYRALFRKGFGDLRTRRVQTALLFIVVAAAAAILMLAISLPQSVAGSFDRAHDEAHGAHVWYGANGPEAAERVSKLPGVVESTPVYENVSGVLMGASEPDDVFFTGIGPDDGGISPAVVTEGRWLEAGGENELVVTRGLARKSGLEVGDVVQAAAVYRGMSLTVVGIAIDTGYMPYPVSRPGVVFVSRETVRRLTGGPVQSLADETRIARQAFYTVGVRVDDPEAAPDFESEAWGAVEGLRYSRNWVVVRDLVGEINEGPSIIMRVFGFFGLFGAGIIVASAITGHAMAQTREVGVLKATGFSPGHVTLLFLGQQLALGLLAAVTGVIAAIFLTPLILNALAELLYSGVSAEVDPASMAMVVAGIGGLIVVFTLAPSWRAGRISTMQAISGRHQRGVSKPSLLARLAIRLHMSQVMVFGMKDIFARKTRAWLTVSAVAVMAAIMMMTLTLFVMLDRLVSDPVSLGAWPFELRVDRFAGFGTDEAAGGRHAAGVADPIPQDELVNLIESHPEVEAHLTIWSPTSGVEGIDGVIQTFVVDGPVDQFRFRVTDGRMFSAPNEAVVGLGLAEAYSLEVGDRITVLAPVRLELTVAGIFAFASNSGRVLMYRADTLPGIDADGSLALKLAQGVDAAGLAEKIIAETGGRVAVTNVAQEYRDSVDDELALKPLMLSLNGILIALAATNMMIALLFAVRERTREFGIMKTVGFSPEQIVFTVVVGAIVISIIGVAISAPMGYYLTRLWMSAADTEGLPGDLVQVPSMARLALMVPLAAGLAALGSALPARRAAGITVNEALRLE